MTELAWIGCAWAGTARLARDAPLAAHARRLAAGLIAVLALIGLFAGLAFAIDFPQLTGRVVDQANVIPEAVRAPLTEKLEQLEAKSGIQLVVATVNSLQGEEIEPYANALFRTWKLGEKQKNNGVLLLVAPKEHRVRIEVGYGLEGTLTDALSKIIISNAMAPRFKTGDYGGGIERGVDDVITVLTTDSAEWQKRPELRVDRQDTEADRLGPWIAFALFAFIIFMLLRSPQRDARQTRLSRWGGPQTGVVPPGPSRWGRTQTDNWGDAPPQRGSSALSGFLSLLWNILSFLLGVLMSSGGRGGGWGDGSGGSSGGGFSGGGGSSGGGGASGSW